jgi:hypothetical protein
MTYLELVAEHGGIRPAARVIGIGESTLRYRLKREMTIKAEDDEAQASFVFTSNRPLRPVIYEPLVHTRYFILTSAQDSSEVHEDFWNALNVYAEWLGECEIIVSGFTYSKKLFEDHDNRSAKVGFHPSIDQFIAHERIRIGDEVDFCGEMNTLPTAVTPLSGFATYTRARWGVFPHPKVQLESVATMKHERSKQLMTTGAVTLPNYIRKKAGIKATFHHQIGAVLVEMTPDGATYCRHLLTTDLENGSFYDLDRYITSAGVSTGHRVEAITYGDVHHEKLDPEVALLTWGYDVSEQVRWRNLRRTADEGETEPLPLIDRLRPKHEFFHDLCDFSPRNHHSIKDIHFRFAAHTRKGQSDNVQKAIDGCAKFIKEVARPDCTSVVVESNHDQALVKWLKTADYRDDPENALFFLSAQRWIYQEIAAGDPNPDVFQRVMRECGTPDDVVFCNEDQSFIVCGDIECGMHGHLGPNGSRGSPLAISRSGRKSNTGHTHSPAIRDGAYVAGVSGKLDMGYNKGPSSWSNSHIITYPNGKRTIITLNRGRFHA